MPFMHGKVRKSKPRSYTGVGCACVSERIAHSLSSLALDKSVTAEKMVGHITKVLTHGYCNTKYYLDDPNCYTFMLAF